jgi:glycosyltransferase involved in cell wall biosynthesis
MKILLVQDTDWITRNPIHHNHLVERLILKGHEIRVIDFDITWRTNKGKKTLKSNRQTFHVARLFNAAKHTVIRPGIIHVPLLDYLSMLFTYTSEIKRQIKEFKPEVLYLDTILTAYLASRLAKRYNIKTIYYCIDKCYKLIPYKFLQPFGKFIESRNMKLADRVLSINQKLSEYTIKMGAKREKCLVLKAGIDYNNFDPTLDGDRIREKYGIKSTDKILFFVGWIYHFSGLKEVAIELSRVQDENIKLFIVGDGDAFKDLQNIRKKYKLENRMIMADKQPYENLPEYLAIADICLLPAYDNEIMRDIVPIKLYDYMAMAKPVIATKLPGVMQEFGENNGVVYVSKPEDVVQKAIELLNNGLCKELGRKARYFAEQNSWDIITEQFENIIRKVVKE